jgi:hypothetical protein
MLSDFFARIRHEATLSLTGLRESLVSIAERANRQVQIVKLHAQSSSIVDQMNTHFVALGAVLAEQLSAEPSRRHALFLPTDVPPLGQRLHKTHQHIQRLRRELHHLTHQITEIETETLTDTLLRIHRDLTSRGAAVERLVLQPGSPATGKTTTQFERATRTRLIAVCRGPALITAFDHLTLAPGDVLLLIGSRQSLGEAISTVSSPAKASP